MATLEQIDMEKLDPKLFRALNGQGIKEKLINRWAKKDRRIYKWTRRVNKLGLQLNK